MAWLKRLVAAQFIVLALVTHGSGAFAQSGRTIKLIVAMPAGASTDSVARAMAEQIGKAQGVTMVVENRVGASGMIGTEAAARAAPDGTTLLMSANTYLIDAQTRKANYHPVTAFDPICRLVQTPAVFVVNSASPYRNLKDLFDAAKAKPGELSTAAVGPGSTFQMGFNSFTRMAGVNMIFVPFPGSGPAVTAVLGEHVTSAFAGYAQVAEHIKAGKLRALGVATAKRIEPMPDLPTFDESGFKNLEVDVWFGAMAPAGVPKELLTQLIGWFRTALADPEVKTKLALQGLYPVESCGEEFGAYIRKRYDDYGEAIRDANMKPQ
jgi:tripartite-type tricarboxylate transporter receptor subunit TctC